MARRKPRQGNDLCRKTPVRESYERVLIICEGEKTEPNYFCEIRDYYKLSTANVDVIPADGSNPVNVVRSAKKRQQDERKMGEQFDRIYCVFDRDEHANYDAACQQVKDNNFELANSVPCFEYWLLLHFEDTAAPFNAAGGKTAAQNVVAALERKYPGYTKAKTSVFMDLIDDMGIAIKRAERRIVDADKTGDDNPSTRVHLLVDYLQKLNE